MWNSDLCLEGCCIGITYSSEGVNILQVLGKPSAELASKMSSEEKERVCKQQECLGEEGLREKGQQLEKAIAQNEVILTVNYCRMKNRPRDCCNPPPIMMVCDEG